MALTQLKTGAIADDAVTTDKLANAINTERTANTAKTSLENDSVTLAKMAGGTDGQIITYDASGDPVAVGPGTDGQVLTSTGAGSPPAFEAIPASGKILQVINTLKTDTQSSSGDTFVDISGLTISITPSSSSNKVLVRGYVALSTQLNGTGNLKVFRDSTEICKSTADSTAANNSTAMFKVLNAGATTTTGRSQMWQLQFEVLDTPNTTSAVTYKCQFAELHIGATIYVNRIFYSGGLDAVHHGSVSSITAMEVAA